MLGNLLARVSSPGLYRRLDTPLPPLISVLSSLSSEASESGGSSSDSLKKLLVSVDALRTEVHASLESLEISTALESIVTVMRRANATLSHIEPWRVPDNCTPTMAANSLVVMREALRVLGIVLQPFIPATSERLLDALSVPSTKRTWEYAEVGKLGNTDELIVNVKDLVGKSLGKKCQYQTINSKRP